MNEHPVGPHGGDGARLAAWLGIESTQVLDLSQSLNPVAANPAPIVARHLDALGSYPDPDAATHSLAARLGITPDRIVLTNGGSEAIALVARDLGRGWVTEPDFSLYRRHLRVLDPTGPQFRSNPHSPSGVLAAADDRRDVWDEAFYPLATGTWTRGDADRGSWVVGSLTKLLACPGLRVGYVLAPDGAAADRIRADQPLWSVGGLVCAALPDLLATVELGRWQRAMVALRVQLTDLLRAHSYVAQPSDANWVLVPAPSLRAELGRRAIAIRDCSSFGLEGIVRIAVPNDAGLVRLAAALQEIRPIS